MKSSALRWKVIEEFPESPPITRAVFLFRREALTYIANHSHLVPGPLMLVDRMEKPS